MSIFNNKSLPNTLSKEETYKIIDELKNGSKDSRDKLIRHNLRLVCHILNKMSISVDYCEEEDLFEIGTIGLIKAVNTYDSSKDIEFNTYASACIKNEILMFLRKNKKVCYDDSLDRTVYENKDGSEIKLSDTICDENNLFEEFENTQLYENIKKLVEQLQDRDKEIIKMYFGFYDGTRYNQKEIADKLNITQAYVSRLLPKIINQIGKQLEHEGFIELSQKHINSKKDNIGKRKENNKDISSQTKIIENNIEQIDMQTSLFDNNESGLFINQPVFKDSFKYLTDIEIVIAILIVEYKFSFNRIEPLLKRLSLDIEYAKSVSIKSLEIYRYLLNQFIYEKMKEYKVDIPRPQTPCKLDKITNLCKTFFTLDVNEILVALLKLEFDYKIDFIEELLHIEKTEILDITTKAIKLYEDETNKSYDSINNLTKTNQTILMLENK